MIAGILHVVKRLNIVTLVYDLVTDAISYEIQQKINGVWTAITSPVTIFDTTEFRYIAHGEVETAISETVTVKYKVLNKIYTKELTT